MIENDLTPEQQSEVVGYWVATDKLMSGWGCAPGRSLVAVACRDSDQDKDAVERRLRLRKEMKRVRWVWASCLRNVRVRRGDHLHVYGFDSFRYPL